MVDDSVNNSVDDGRRGEAEFESSMSLGVG